MYFMFYCGCYNEIIIIIVLNVICEVKDKFQRRLYDFLVKVDNGNNCTVLSLKADYLLLGLMLGVTSQ